MVQIRGMADEFQTVVDFLLELLIFLESALHFFFAVFHPYLPVQCLEEIVYCFVKLLPCSLNSLLVELLVLSNDAGSFLRQRTHVRAELLHGLLSLEPRLRNRLVQHFDVNIVAVARSEMGRLHNQRHTKHSGHRLTIQFSEEQKLVSCLKGWCGQEMLSVAIINL